MTKHVSLPSNSSPGLKGFRVLDSWDRLPNRESFEKRSRERIITLNHSNRFEGCFVRFTGWGRRCCWSLVNTEGNIGPASFFLGFRSLVWFLLFLSSRKKRTVLVAAGGEVPVFIGGDLVFVVAGFVGFPSGFCLTVDKCPVGYGGMPEEIVKSWTMNCILCICMFI